MYKLLLVTDKEDITTLYRDYSEWETLGFERPTITSNAQDAIDKLAKNRFDAVSCLLSVKEGQRFFSYLSKRPEILGMETVREAMSLRREIGIARRALSSRDAARQTKQVDDLTSTLQSEFFCDLLRGVAFEPDKIDERIRSLKMTAIDPKRPVVTSSFRLPQGDYFLSEVWRYGRDRLENALRNIFESGDVHVGYILLIINPHHMRLISVPRENMTREQVENRMHMHLDRCQASLEEYFELTLTIKRVVSYESLYALCEENAVRTAH